AYLRTQGLALRNKIQGQELRVNSDRPIIGLLIGGDAKNFRLTVEKIDVLITQLKQSAKQLGAQILLTTSRRTPRPVEDSLKQSLAGFSSCKLLVIANQENIPEAVGGIFGLSDVIVVSGESISMVSEAVSSGKYVLVFMPDRKTKALSKQERFLRRLEEAGLIKVIPTQALHAEIDRLWREKPKKKQLDDKELIDQALSKIIR
ncbi:ELM1/GtrOC1 family putative glycosyltransferase, partial [Candidatus Omnitrophota bacterium]